MRSLGVRSETNLSADGAAFVIQHGGIIACTFSAASWGTVTLQKRAGDGTTFVTAMTAWTANGTAAGYLCPGTYKVAVSGATGVYVEMQRVPGE